MLRFSISFAIASGLLATPAARAEVTEVLMYNATQALNQRGAQGLLQGSDGALYGTTKGANSGYGDNGSVFKVTLCTDYPYRTLLPFTSNEQIVFGLTEGPDGLLYGVSLRKNYSDTNGMLFRITKAGKLDVLHSFDGPGGRMPSGPPLITEDGTIYGVTFYGGITGQNSNGFGTVYKLPPGGDFSLVYDFGTDAGRNGSNPHTRLARDDAGNLYGTASNGGANNAGTVFKLDPAGKISVLVSFGGGGDAGSRPSDLLRAHDGTFYGKLFGGGGIVFALTADGKLSTLHGFTKETDGALQVTNYQADIHVAGTLIEAADGKLYGTATSGGPYMEGTVYAIDPKDGAFSIVYAFKGTSDGGQPLAIIQGEDGNLYGTALAGGSNTDYGGVFRIALDGKLDLKACPASDIPPSASSAGSSGGGGRGGSPASRAGAGGARAADEDQEPHEAGSGAAAGRGTTTSGQSTAGGPGAAGRTSGSAGEHAKAGSDGNAEESEKPKKKDSSCSVAAPGSHTVTPAWLACTLALAAAARRRRRR